MNNAKPPSAQSGPSTRRSGGPTVADRVLKQTSTHLTTDQAQLTDMLRRSNELRYRIVRQIRRTLDTLRSRPH